MNARPVHLFLLALKSPSRRAFEVAIDACADEKCVHLEAMARERFAIYLEGDCEGRDPAHAKTQLEHSYWLYQDWSAHAKAAEMSGRHSWLKVRGPGPDMTFGLSIRPLTTYLIAEHVARQGKVLNYKPHSVDRVKGFHHRNGEKERCVCREHNTRYKESCVCEEQEKDS